MNTKDAVLKVLLDTGISRYRMAKDLNLQPIMIKNYIDKGTRMGRATAERFESKYGEKISDIFDNRSSNATTPASNKSE